MASTPETEAPECPVCLQPYDSQETIPRVLACGHSSCQLCLAQLPRPRSLSSPVIRCPVCIQLVKFSHPTDLPKNIDLLRYSLSSSPKPHNIKPLISSPPRPRFPPETLSSELYAAWKDWILPNGSVVRDKEAGFGRIRIHLGLSVIVKCRLVDDQKDFTHVHTFWGHEHKVMAMVFLDQEKPLCISADIGGGIFCWEVATPFGQEPVKKWCEENDWRYSGIHALAVSESGCLYTGSGDRLVKSWSLRDYTLLCCMEGHKSVVSTLAVCDGTLYSGSWDGTVRLWCLHDHTPLAVFAEGMSGKMSSVLSLYADRTTVIATHENGIVKIWVNDELKSSMQVHQGSTFALSKKDKWVFTGGWDRTVKVQEIIGERLEMEIREVGSVACDSVITALLYEQGMLFVGCANKLIKSIEMQVYHTEP